jgi:hypothetical protein
VGQAEAAGGYGAAAEHADRSRTGQYGGKRQAQVVEQPAADDVGQQARATFAQDAGQAAAGQCRLRRLEVHGVVARHDDVGDAGQRGAAVRGGGGAGDDDRSRVRGGLRDQRGGRVQVERAADQRQRGSGRPTAAQSERRPAGRGPGRLVALGACRAGPDEDHVRQAPQQPEDPPVGWR